MPNLLLSLTQKKKDFYIPSFKRNNEELKGNFARIDKGKNSDVNTEVSNLCLKLLLGRMKILNLSSLVIIVILLVILGPIVLS